MMQAGVAMTGILVVDDHPVVARGIADIVDVSDHYRLVGTAFNFTDALRAIEASKPQIIILDLRVGDQVAPEVIPRVSAASPLSKVVILTAFDDGPLIDRCLDLGVRAVLLKDTSDIALISALDQVMRGKLIVDERFRGDAGAVRPPSIGDGFEHLSAREYEILCLLARGMNTREMARELELRPNTIRSYTQAVLEKLRSKNRVMALATARRLKII